jgi:hypothetical protein
VLTCFIQFVILVGGFGRQPYLYTRMQEDVNREYDVEGKIEILQSQGAEP